MGSLCSLGWAEASRPNVIVILADDLGYADVGFNGSDEIRTPHIDRLASEGARFTNAYVSAPICGPSRAGLLTGRYQDRFGFGRNPTIDPSEPTSGLPLSETPLSEALASVGYRSGVIGKWHLGVRPEYHPQERGFDHFFGFLSGGHNYFGEELTLNDFSECERAYDWYRLRLMRGKERVDTKGYLTDLFSEDAVSFIGEQESGTPFFLYLAYNAPHGPLQATEKYLARYAHVENPKRRTYAAMVSALDDGVGAVLAELERRGLSDNTLVVFLSDNGGPASNASRNKPLRGFKSSPFEGGLRVPFALRWPSQIEAGQVYERPIISLDIFATAAAAAGYQASADRPLDGVNLLPFLRGEAQGDPHEALYWKSYDKGWVAIRKGDAKLIEGLDGKEYYFQVSDDISESKNLLENRSAEAGTLSERSAQWNAETIAPIAPGLGSWLGNRAAE